MKSRFIWITVIALAMYAIWMYARRPIIIIDEPWDPVLIYSEFTLYGRKNSGLRYLHKVPPEIQNLYDVKLDGWWYVLKQDRPIDDSDPDLQDVTDADRYLKGLDKYYSWHPIEPQ